MYFSLSFSLLSVAIYALAMKLCVKSELKQIDENCVFFFLFFWFLFYFFFEAKPSKMKKTTQKSFKIIILDRIVFLLAIFCIKQLIPQELNRHATVSLLFIRIDIFSTNIDDYESLNAIIECVFKAQMNR